MHDLSDLSELSELLERRWLLVGVGNDLRGDDGFGSLLARRLRSAGLPALDGGTAPENLTGPIRKAAPELLIVADAAGLDLPVGALRLLPGEALSSAASGTHDPGLGLMLGFLQHELSFTTRLLAVQPGRCELGTGPGPEVQAALERLSGLFAPEPSRSQELSCTNTPSSRPSSPRP
jgi:hydrogenase 3 maturation protease